MNAGEIIVIPFPFTDLSGSKVRPAYVLSGAKYNASRNIVVAAISSKPGRRDFAIPLSQADLTSGTLTKDSFIRMQNIFTIEKRLIREKVACVDTAKSTEVYTSLQKIFE